MLAVHWDTIRLFLHVLAATVWVGGQLTLAGLVPALRAAGGDAAKAAANGFNKIAWPAFAVLMATGIWNVAATADQATGAYNTTLIVKLGVVGVSGLAAYLHAQADSRKTMAVYGALTGISALAALFLGVLLAG